MTTVIEGINQKDINIRELAKKLKSKLACGGTAKKGIIELQGSHKKEIKDELIKLGFPSDTITID